MGYIERFPTRNPIMTAKATTGIGQGINVSDFKNIQLSVATAGTATCTIKIQGSLSKDIPDFSTSASSTNQWDYIACYDYSNPSAIVIGSTGFAASGTDICKNILVNVDGLVWLNCVITSISAGTVTIQSLSFNNS